MNRLWRAMIYIRIWRDDHGQDLIEYALVAGFVAFSFGATTPAVAQSIVKVFSKVSITTVASVSHS